MWYDVLMKKAAVTAVVPVTGLGMSSGLPKSVIRSSWPVFFHSR